MDFTSRPSLLISSLIWLAVTLFGVYFLLHLKQYINFGIDLVGGTYLTLDVKVEEAVKNELMSVMEYSVEQLKKENKKLPGVPKVDVAKSTGTLTFETDQEAADAYSLISSQPSRDITISKSNNTIVYTLPSAKLHALSHDTIEGNISILHARLDEYGAGEIPIIQQGERSIVIELPNVSDPEQAKARIGKAALLEMKPIYEFAKTKDELLEKIGKKEPEEGTMIIEGRPGSKECGFYLVPSFTKLTGKLLKNVSYKTIQVDIFTGGLHKTPHVVDFEFNAEGAAEFYKLTKNHLHEPIAIIIDNVVVSAPIAEKAIDGGSAYIHGDFTEESAKELVVMLKSGAFAAPVEFVEERTIRPSLGQESIHKGLMSCAIGLALLFIFSVLVYKMAGVFAFVVLLYNLLLILFGLALIHGTLTLPGIAGMVLTVGMAIDSSILIYERIKEELAMGSSLRKAVDQGFSGATAVILDANITTFIIGAVLYYFGSPAIQGFALALMIGIISTLITGLVLLRWIFNFVLDIVGAKKISI